MRIERLDFLRGLAILGMLVANIPWHVGNSMSRVHEPDMTSVIAWLNQYLLFDSRFLPIFCFLFGASYLILAEKQDSFHAFRTYYLKRMLILLLLGICHAYLLWPGDILITYACCGFLLLFFHNCSIVQLMGWGLAFILINLIFGQWPEVYNITLRAMLFDWWVDYGDEPMTIVQAYSGSYLELMQYNFWRNQFLQWTALPYFRIWNALGLMLIGMALFRMGILQGERSTSFYKTVLGWTLLSGTPLVLYGVIARIGINPTIGPWLGFTLELPLSNFTYRAGCLFLSVSVLVMVHLYWNKLSTSIIQAIEAVGRLALTNYLLQSLLLLIIFHFIGVFPFDSIDHDVMLLIVLAVWSVHLAGSRLWLSHFERGPVEMLYRYMSKVRI